MGNEFSYSKATEKPYFNDIEAISMNMGIPADEVKRIYNLVLKRFQRGARIRDFLPILVSRRVKHLLYVRIRNKGGIDAIAH